jgi:hypothetical protein
MMHSPKSIDDAYVRRDVLVAEKLRLDAELSNRDMHHSGRRLSNVEWNRWRQERIGEKTSIEVELRELKAWMRSQRAAFGIGKEEGNPRDAVYWGIRSAERMLTLIAGHTDNSLDEDERILLGAMRGYLETHRVLE